MRLIEGKARFFLLQLFLIYILSFAQFDPSRFNFGTDWDFLGKNNNTSTSVATAVDYVTIWLNDSTFNNYWHGDMLRFCKKNNKTPVFYSYIIAKASRLGDADQGGRLDLEGGGWLRNNFNLVKNRYENYARETANIYGTTAPIIWLMEPDYYQYCNGNGNDISMSEAGNYMKEMINCVKKYLPNALFSFDISPWNNDQAGYMRNFDMSLFTFLHTSGGRTQPASDRIRWDNNNNVTWNGAYSAAGGKCIIADCGYGVGGQSEGHIAGWDDINNIKNRINDGVVAITQKNPRTDWGNTINSLKSSLSGIKTKCNVVFKKSYTLTVNVSGNGKVTINPEKTSYDSGTTVTLTAQPNSGYKLKSWSGDVTGTNTTVTITMNSNKSVTATFVDINAKPTYTLTIVTKGSGIVEVDPDQREFDSGKVVTLIASPVVNYTFNGWSGDTSTTERIIEVIMNKNKSFTASFSGPDLSIENLIKNGDFSKEQENWTFGAWNNAKATGTVSEGAFKISVQQGGSENWHIQLLQAGIKLTKDVKYVLTFTAWAQSATSMTVSIEMNADPYTPYMTEKNVSLTTEKKRYSYSFTMKETTTDARLAFNCGKSTSAVFIDDVSLTVDIEVKTIIPQLPFVNDNSEINLNSKEKVYIFWYDQRGRLVQTISGTSSEYYSLLKKNTLKIPGAYLTVIKAGNREIKRKSLLIR
ncbi:MAG: carbohydrate binding domain-containing protein [Chitinispirillaceae bacterium]|nr:carbohydrate binding domain-containing protein [Chitinispirillaceae bacterium]